MSAIEITTENLDKYPPGSRRRRSSALNTPLSPSALPELTILPQPVSEDKVLVGQFVSSASKLNPKLLEDRDYDDSGARWYKDVIVIDTKTGKFKDSLGATLYLSKEAEEGTAIGTIEAREMRVRMLKDSEAALKKVLQDAETKTWVQSQKGDVGFITAVREVVNASYKRARLVDRGAGNWEVVREISGEGSGGKRRDSGLDVETGSKRDVVGVVVKKVLLEGGEAKLGEEMSTEMWN